MKLTIHRGTKEIGGSCVELTTATTRLVLDLGLPLVDANREPFDSRGALAKSVEVLKAEKVIPPILGLFDENHPAPDAVLLSHAHLDHAGLLHQVHGDRPLPPQALPMLLTNWDDLDETEATEIEADGSGWLIQQKLDGVRALLHVEPDGVRITSRTVSEVNYRLSEFQANVPHLAEGFESLVGTILDGELICPIAAIDTGTTRTENALQATMAILATTPVNAQQVQAEQNARLVFHAFDILKLDGAGTIYLPLVDRLDLLHQAVRRAQNPYVVEVPTEVIGKVGIHENLLVAGAEGTVWKEMNSRYECGTRSRSWFKRKRSGGVGSS